MLTGERDPRDSIVREVESDIIDNSSCSSASTEELSESSGAEEYRNKKRELAMTKVHNRNQFSRSNFNQKGNRFVSKKCGRRGK